MSSIIGRRRYLTNFDAHRVPHLFADTLVIGAGVAGLRAALAAAQNGDVLVVAKDAASLSATSWAQGGIAAALAPGDSPAAHAADTLAAGADLCEPAAVQAIVAEAPQHIAELVEWGARFDRDGPGLALGLEGAHGQSRIIHALGDETGRELARVLLEQVRSHPRIRLFEHCFAIDLLSEDHVVRGAITFHTKYGHQMFWATTTILASGGLGRIYRETTNPRIATGDGLAMALRAGATLRDLEMVQFHPTTLYVAGAARALISEAVRGEGALLVNHAGERFMQRYDERGELASRDVVSRAIVSELRREGSAYVFLDVRGFKPGEFAARFPSIHRLCLDFDLDPQRDLIPVRPSAHYSVGGVIADLDGRSGIDGLLACGEVASTGLHGANRLASNSLLEGLVVGARAGRLAAERARDRRRLDRPPAISHVLPASSRTELDVEDVLHSLQSVMSRNVAVERSGDRLRETEEIIDFWSRYVLDKVFDGPAAWETQNMLTVARCLTTAAATRCESRGAHYRTDFPRRDEHWRCHIDVRRHEDTLRVATAPLTA